jgi:phage shock protein E
MRIILLLLSVLFSGLMLTAQQNFKNADAAEFKKLIESGDYELIDLRTSDEINRKGKIRGARQIDFLSLDAEKKILALDRKKKYLVYCAGGGRSSDCAALMKDNGFGEVVNLENGFDDWKKKGHEVEKLKNEL